MRAVLLVSLGGATLVVIAFVVLAMSHRRGSLHEEALTRVEVPRAHFAVLSTEEAIHEAATRAAFFERSLSQRANERATHYEELASASDPLATQAVVLRPLASNERDGEPRSA